jgi:hypothetical protein
VPQGHWAFMASGVDDDLTIRFAQRRFGRASGSSTSLQEIAL